MITQTGATRRLLNLSASASWVGKPDCDRFCSIGNHTADLASPAGPRSYELQKAYMPVGSDAAPGLAGLSDHDSFGRVAAMTQLLERLGGRLVDAVKFREQQFQGISECPAWVARSRDVGCQRLDRGPECSIRPNVD